MRCLLLFMGLMLAVPMAAAEPDVSLPPPTDLTVTHDASQGKVALSWTAPANASVTYSFNVYVNGQYVVSVTGTTATLNITSNAVAGGIYQVTTVLGEAESMPATSSVYQVHHGPCELATVGVIPPGVNVHEECIPDPIEYVLDKVQIRPL